MQKWTITLSVCLYTIVCTAQVSTGGLVRRGMDLRDQDRPAEALDCFRQAIAGDPGNLRAHAEYVRTQAYDLNRFDEVRAEYEALMRRYPDNPVYPMALATGQFLTPGDGKRAWYERVARRSPESAWGLFAKARLTSEKETASALALVDRAIELDPAFPDAWSLAISLREYGLHDLPGALAIASRLAARPEPKLRAEGLFDQWRLKLLLAKESPEALAELREELRSLAANEKDLDILISVHRTWSALLHEKEGERDAAAAIRRVDAAWYPERGARLYFPTGNESGVPIQGIAVNRQVKIVNAVFGVDAALTAAQKIDALRALLPDCTSASVRRLVYQRLYRVAAEADDGPAIIEFGEKYKEESSRMFPGQTDPALLARIALARADQSSDLPRAAAYARQAFDATFSFQPWERLPNTDPAWMSSHTGQEERYRTTRALALEAHAWTLCRTGHCAEAEPLLRQSMELRRSERILTRLAKMLDELGRAAEASEVRGQAENEWLESLKRRLRKTPSRDFTAPALDGRPVRLSSLQGKVVLVNFWATWCTPCTQEMPVLAQLYRKYRDRGLEILAVSVDEDSSRYKVDRFANERNLDFPVLYDNGAASLYGVAAYPTSILIDRQGVVRLRFNLLERRSFEAIVDELLKGEL